MGATLANPERVCSLGQRRRNRPRGWFQNRTTIEMYHFWYYWAKQNYPAIWPRASLLTFAPDMTPRNYRPRNDSVHSTHRTVPPCTPDPPILPTLGQFSGCWALHCTPLRAGGYWEGLEHGMGDTVLAARGGSRVAAFYPTLPPPARGIVGTNPLIE